MKLDERHLIQLAAVAQTGSVTKGASLLGMTQPAVSRTLAMLEKRLGEPLFMKGQRPLQPTPIGNALADHGMVMLYASQKASETAQNFKSGHAGTIRIGGTPFLMDALISRIIAEFQNNYPEIRIDQSYGYLKDLRESLRNNRIDIAVCPIDILGEGSGLIFKEVLPGKNVIACSSIHPLLNKQNCEALDILNYPWIAPPSGSPLFADMESVFISLGATEIKVRYTGGSLAGIVNYLALSNALTILPLSVVFAYRNEQKLSALPLKVPHPERALGILRRQEDTDDSIVDNFEMHVRNSFEDLRYLMNSQFKSFSEIE